MRILFFVVASALVACESVADLNVKYTPDAAAPASDGGAPAPDAAAAAASVVIPDITSPPKVIASCGSDCDTTAGMGCCLSGSGTCISQNDYATACPSGGVFVGCFQPTADANCCWHDIGGSRVALAAAVCADGYACLVDTDCPSGTGACAKTTCHGVDIGQCGTAPACP